MCKAHSMVGLPTTGSLVLLSHLRPSKSGTLRACGGVIKTLPNIFPLAFMQHQVPIWKQIQASNILVAVFVCQATEPSTSAKIKFLSLPKVRVAFSLTGLPQLTSQTHLKMDSDLQCPSRSPKMKHLELSCKNIGRMG